MDSLSVPGIQRQQQQSTNIGINFVEQQRHTHMRWEWEGRDMGRRKVIGNIHSWVTCVTITRFNSQSSPRALVLYYPFLYFFSCCYIHPLRGSSFSANAPQCLEYLPTRQERSSSSDNINIIDILQQ